MVSKYRLCFILRSLKLCKFLVERSDADPLASDSSSTPICTVSVFCAAREVKFLTTICIFLPISSSDKLLFSLQEQVLLLVPIKNQYSSPHILSLTYFFLVLEIFSLALSIPVVFWCATLSEKLFINAMKFGIASIAFTWS